VERRSFVAAHRGLNLVRAVVFDCDGVLVDTAFAWNRALHDLAQRHGVVFENGFGAAMKGGSVPEATEFLERELGYDLDERVIGTDIYDSVIASMSRGVRAMNGAVQLLESLRGTRPLAIASNGSIETVRAALRAADIPDVFDAIVALDGSRRPKPEPDLYGEACARLGVDPGDAIAIEDSVRGATSARRAGLSVVGVGDATTLGSVCDVVVATLQEARLRDVLDDEATP
jgi:HAD superfamily hydrolase (TIGR01509 family)